MASLSPRSLNKVRQLYQVQGHSMKDVADHFGVSLNAVVYFMRRHHIPRREISESNKIKYDRMPLSFSPITPRSRREKELKIMGTVLYWGEGYKTGKAHTVDLANGDPCIVKLFVLFLRKICRIREDKMRVYLYCYSNQDSRQLISYWSNLTRIPISQFSKPYVRNDFRVEKKDKMPYGLVHIRYNDKKLLGLIKQWIEEYKNEYCAGGGVVNRTTL